MPLRDHFRAPLSEKSSWEGFHAGWPMMIVHQLRRQLPAGYVAEPGVHRGSQIEIDVAAFEKDESHDRVASANGGGVATAVWAPPQPNVSVETNLLDADEYEVRIYDAQKGRHLVAAVEIVSPSNKDRPENRNIFVAKCVGLLRKGVAVSIIDLVSVRHFNLYAELLSFIKQSDPTLGESPPTLYATSCRWTERKNRNFFEAWSHELSIGQPLPTLPLWLSQDLVVPLDLGPSYEQTCYDLWIT